MWDGVSFIVGILLGMVLMLVVVWICWSTRTLVFTVCPKSKSAVCRGLDYVNLPGVALAAGVPLEQILFLESDGLYYKRVPKIPNCVPMPATQTVKVRFPQYCSFNAQDGMEIEAKQVSPGAPVYRAVDAEIPLEVMSNGNCSVERSTPFVVGAGRPLLKWDPLSVNEELPNSPLSP